MPGAEQRRSIRHSVERCTGLVRRKGLFFWDKEPDRAMVVDLSAQGVGFYSKLKLRPGDVIRVAFEVSGNAAIPPGVEMMAEVRWVNPAQAEPGSFRVGCAFRDLTPEQTDLIARLIQIVVVRPR